MLYLWAVRFKPSNRRVLYHFSSVLFGSYLSIFYLCGMETVFDHNITKEEISRIGILRKELYLKVVDEESANLDLAFLYHERGNRKLVDKYLKGVPPYIAVDFWRTVTHP